MINEKQTWRNEIAFIDIKLIYVILLSAKLPSCTLLHEIYHYWTGDVLSRIEFNKNLFSLLPDRLATKLCDQIQK